jgi:hypothetical protein
MGLPHFNTSVYLTKSQAEENLRGVETKRNMCILAIEEKESEIIRN